MISLVIEDVAWNDISNFCTCYRKSKQNHISTYFFVPNPFPVFILVRCPGKFLIWNFYRNSTYVWHTKNLKKSKIWKKSLNTQKHHLSTCWNARFRRKLVWSPKSRPSRSSWIEKYEKSRFFTQKRPNSFDRTGFWGSH